MGERYLGNPSDDAPEAAGVEGADNTGESQALGLHPAGLSEIDPATGAWLGGRLALGPVTELGASEEAE